jgi:hypothetical protein
MVRSFVRLIIRSFVQIIFVQPYAAEIPIVRSSDHSIVRPFVHSSYSSFIVSLSDRSIVRPFVRPNNLCSAVMLPKF